MTTLKKSFIIGLFSCLFFTLAFADPEIVDPTTALSKVSGLIHERHLDAANELLDQIPLTDLSTELKNQHTLLSARIALLQHDSDAVLHLLERIENPVKLSEADAITYHLLAAHAYVGMNKPLLSIRERVTLQFLIKDEKNQQLNLDKLWMTLSSMGHVTQDVIEQESVEVADWLQLSSLAQDAKLDSKAETQLEGWLATHPHHPGVHFITRTETHEAVATSIPDQFTVALLLPMTGPLAEAGKAVQNGFLAAQASEAKSKSTLNVRVYDTSKNTNITALYDQALKEGAKFIIGPMQKNAVVQLSKRGHFEVPTLALNYAAMDPMQNFFQFGLSPQDEAAQVAKRAFADGKRSALIIAPKDEWGQGIVDSFLEQWQALGGHVVGAVNYAKTDNMDQQIRRLLEIDKSLARRKEVQQAIGTKMTSDLRHRMDGDLLFVVGSPTIARQIRPLLKFYYASNLPVYSSSMIYTGVQNTQNDRDIDGVRFCDMPWVLQSAKFQAKQAQLVKLVPRGLNNNTRLYAIGMDSYALVAKLSNPSNFPNDGIAAASGRLMLNPNQQISRDLLWATFRNGAPTIM